MNRIVTVGLAAIGFTLAVPQIAYATPSPQSTATYTMAQVATHKTADDCWSAVGRGVYNLTTWLPTHATATATVATVCGVDSSAIFGVSTPTSARHDDDNDNADENGTDNEDRSTVRQTRAKAAHVAMHQGNNGRRDHGRGHGRGHGHNDLFRSIVPFRIGTLADAAVATTPPPVTPPPVTTPSTNYTLAQVQTHNVATNCWTIISGKVYNLTSFVQAHKGGPTAITGLCGIDGTAKFTAMHGGAATPASVLAGLQVGTLV